MKKEIITQSPFKENSPPNNNFNLFTENKVQNFDNSSEDKLKFLESENFRLSELSQKQEYQLDKVSKELDWHKQILTESLDTSQFYLSKLRDMELIAFKDHILNKEEMLVMMQDIIKSENECELTIEINGKINFKYI